MKTRRIHRFLVGRTSRSSPISTLLPKRIWGGRGSRPYRVYQGRTNGPLKTALLCLLATGPLALQVFAAQEPPVDWVDADTGHRVIRLSHQPGSSSLYFHQNSYTPEGDKLIFEAPGGIAALELASLGLKPPKLEIVVTNGSALAMARRSREVYFFRAGALWAANVDTRIVRQVFQGRAAAINCDETFVVRTVTATDPSGNVTAPPPRPIPPQLERMFAESLKANIPS